MSIYAVTFYDKFDVKLSVNRRCVQLIKADIPQDVTEYKEQFFLGMTGRQIQLGFKRIIAMYCFVYIGR